MDINIRIHVTPGTARRLAYFGVTLLLTGLAGMAYALPVTFASHQKLTAAQLNENFAALDQRIITLSTLIERKADKSDVPTVTQWTSYEPVLTTSEGHGQQLVTGQTTLGYYRRVGDSIEVRTITHFDAAPAASSAAACWQWSLPEGLIIDQSRIGPIGQATVGGGLAQALPQETFALGVYVRAPQAISAAPAGSLPIYVNQQNPVAFAKDSWVTLYFTVPILGWAEPQ